ncbi:MAG: TolC family protein [Proteobacteria bacterium]|nr:TolC family protein [Pseudomonadota bacterium]
MAPKTVAEHARPWLRSLLLALPWLLGGAAWAGGPVVSPAGVALEDDPLLAGLMREALERRPELAELRATIRAEGERVPQSRALPDPALALGLQNDGFRSLRLGEAPTSFVSIAASQTFPWYGKRRLRGEVILLGTRQAEAELGRLQLSIRAEVARAYVDLLLVRDQLALLTKVEALWTQAAGLARALYEVGTAAQTDLLRAQLERSRLRQRRWALVAEDARRVVVLNRLRGRALGDAIGTERSLATISDPVLQADRSAFEAAEDRSPELLRSRLALAKAAKQVVLAQKDWLPDLTVSAGVMPRGGSLDPMWQVGVAVPIPLWGSSKQRRAVDEQRSREVAARHSDDATRQLLRQRVAERNRLLAALLATNRLYRSGLLVLSETTVSSTLVQYQVGRVSFAAVLEALDGYLSDVNSFYESLAATQRVAIAQREVSLDAPATLAASGMRGPIAQGGQP